MTKGPRNESVPNGTAKKWEKLWRTDDRAERIKNRYRLATEAAKLGAINDEGVMEVLKEICGGSVPARRVLEVGQHVSADTVKFANNRTKENEFGVSWSHLLEIRHLNHGDQLAYVKRCFKEGLSVRELQGIIAQECEFKGGRKEVRVKELAKKLNSALRDTNSVIGQILALESDRGGAFVEAVENVKKQNRLKTVEELESTRRLLADIKTKVVELEPCIKKATVKLKRLNEDAAESNATKK